MSAPEDLKDIYTDELKDLWSANDQMKKVLKKITTKASDASLKDMLTKSQADIETHTELLKALIASNDEKVSKEHCKGMEGLVTEARKHALEASFGSDDVRDAAIITQYQRLTHYAIAGYGCVRSFANRLELDGDGAVLQECLDNTRSGDENMTRIAESGVNQAAAEG